MSQYTTTEAPRRVALYARYSTDMQNPMSVEDQFRQAERYARQQGWTIVERFSDSAVSGTAGRTRPDFMRLSDALHRGGFDIVLAESLDRISRDQEHLAGFYKAAKTARVEIHTIGRGKVDALTLGLSSMMSAIFLEELSDKVRRGIEGKVLRGLSGGGRIYGYRPGTDERGAPVKGTLAIDEIEAAVVRSIFHDYAAGVSPIKIASRLNEEGLPSPSVGSKRKSSGHWKQNTINGNRERGTGILNNELYVGRRIWNRLSYTKHHQTEKKRSRLNPESDWHIVEVPELRIVSQELWDAVKARQAAQTKRGLKMAATDRNKLSSGQALRRRKYLLSGLLHCGLCGGRMTVAGAGKYKTYYCADAKEKGPSVCIGFRGLRESVALPLVLSGLRDDLLKPEAYARFRDRVHHQLQAAQGAAEDTLRLHDARVRQLEMEQRNLIALAKQGLASDSIVAESRKIDATLARLAATRDEIVPPDIELPEDLPELYRDFVDNLATRLTEASIVSRAADELHELMDRIVVNWDDKAQGHSLTIEGNLLEMLRKSAPRELDAVRGDAIFAEVGCGSRI
ncbi:Site-specific DNA recombinase [Poseidonocella pacifica]|uniref:Site-specific DNA recombinase n=1 Tax=Poseidonocella pacifica TaxID=871651 RepID=A0A1I0YBU0_9RHOB|nr:recombinase family protein [Poseidonocella pacifica]SFB10216.1 Site-specific DNA recombinase [Poseidonocella pacifica]